MPLYGHQDPWLVGFRLYVQRDPIAGVVQPILDMGVVGSISPTLESEKKELFDGDGGVRKLFASGVSQVTEKYDITLHSFHPDNLAFAFLSNPPAAFTQSSAVADVSHYAHPGKLVKMLSSAGKFALGAMSVLGVYTGTVLAVSGAGIVVAAKTITVTGTVTASTGERIVVKGTTAADGTYTVASVTGQIITVVEVIPGADQVAGSVCQEALALTTDYQVVSLERAIIRMVSGGAFTVAGNINIAYRSRSITGSRRLLTPQSAAQVTGNAMLILGRGNNAQQSARICRASFAPTAASLGLDDWSSFNLEMSVLSDILESEPAGQLVYWLGDEPDAA